MVNSWQGWPIDVEKRTRIFKTQEKEEKKETKKDGA